MSTEAETTSTVNNQPVHQAPPKTQPSKKEKKKGKQYLLIEHFYSVSLIFCIFLKLWSLSLHNWHNSEVSSWLEKWVNKLVKYL